MSRIWTYPRGQWTGRLPSLGSDEYGRQTLVLPIPFGPTIVWAFRTCYCEWCCEAREETARWELEESGETDG